MYNIFLVIFQSDAFGCQYEMTSYLLGLAYLRELVYLIAHRVIFLWELYGGCRYQRCVIYVTL